MVEGQSAFRALKLRFNICLTWYHDQLLKAFQEKGTQVNHKNYSFYLILALTIQNQLALSFLLNQLSSFQASSLYKRYLLNVNTKLLELLSICKTWCYLQTTY